MFGGCSLIFGVWQEKDDDIFQKDGYSYKNYAYKFISVFNHKSTKENIPCQYFLDLGE